MPGGMGMINIGEMMGKALGRQTPTKRRKLKVPDAWTKLKDEEADRRLDKDDVNRAAIRDAEQNGIVFLDEVDKIAVSDVRGGSVSAARACNATCCRLIEGTTVATKYGPMTTDHVLFIASGAFHVAKPSDLLPELQGRLPIRVELKGLTEEDFVRILTETRANLPQQYVALLGTEDVTVELTDAAIARVVARIAAEVNESVENIGARRLQTIMERLFEEVSFTAEDRAGETVTIDAADVDRRAGRHRARYGPQPLRALTGRSSDGRAPLPSREGLGVGARRRRAGAGGQRLAHARHPPPAPPCRREGRALPPCPRLAAR